MRRRFFVEQFEGGRAFIEGDAAHHLGHVLRAQSGQLYELSDGEHVHLGRIDSVARGKIEFTLLDELPSVEPTVDVILLLAVVKFDSFEWAIEKATELGVNTIVPLAASRSEKALLTAAPKRVDRWKKTLREASQQSRRVRLPVLADLAKPETAFAEHRSGLGVMLSERAGAPAIRKILSGQMAQKATLAIGPEGGWTDSEFKAAQIAGFQEASLGRLILRTETAVVTALASVNFALGSE